jgi:hypothetical protein
VPHRLLVTLAICTLALCTTAGAVARPAATPRIARGQTLHIRLTTSSFAVCVAVVNYADGGLQLGATKHATDGRLSWAFPVARSRPLGKGTWYVRCGLGIQRTGAFIVVNPPAAG